MKTRSCLWVAPVALALFLPIATLPQNTGEERFPLPALQQPQGLTISPDGTQIAYIANGHLYLKGAGAPQFVAGTEAIQDISQPMFSPDGTSIAFVTGSDQTIRRVSSKGGTPTIVTRVSSPPFGMHWAANDQIFFAQLGGPMKGVMRVAASGGAPETVVALEGNEVALTPYLLPGNETILFTLGIIPQGPASVVDILAKAQVVAQSLTTRERKVLFSGNDARYTASGHLAYVAGGKVMSVPFNPSSLSMSGPAVALTEQVATGAGIGTYQFSISRNGALAYVASPQTELAFLDLKGNKKTLSLYSTPSLFAPRLSPDGRQVTIDTNVGAQSAVWLLNVSGDTQMRRFTPEGQNLYPLWSGDGERLIFISVRQGDPAIYWQRADGSGAAEKLTETARAPESFSIPNQMLSYITLNNGDYDVWLYSFRDKKSTPLVAKQGSSQHSSRFAPDGKSIVYVSDETGRFEAYVQPYPGGAAVQVTKNGAEHPVWSPDGKTLYFDNGGRLYSLPIQTQPTVTSGEPAALPISGFIQGAGRRQFDITPDGQQFLMMFPATQEIRVTRLRD